MEANHKVPVGKPTPVEVTFNWTERQEDYSLVERSHTQVVEKLPVDVHDQRRRRGSSGRGVADDQPARARGGDVKPATATARTRRREVGRQVGDVRQEPRAWASRTRSRSRRRRTVGRRRPGDEEADRRPRGLELLRRHAATGRPALEQGHEARRSPSTSASRRRPPPSASTSTAIPAQDAIKGQVKDEVEVLVSDDGKEFKPAGKFDFNLRWKDIPVNYMWTDEETFVAHNHTLRARSSRSKPAT